MTPILCGAQNQAIAELQKALALDNIVVLDSRSGSGKTLVLRQLHQTSGGVYLAAREFVNAMHDRHPFALEESFASLILESLRNHTVVFVDDIDHLTELSCNFTYPRKGYLDGPLKALVTYATECGKQLVFGCNGTLPDPLQDRAVQIGIARFTANDYAEICAAYLPENQDGLDFEKIHRYAPKLNAYQLRATSKWLNASPSADTAGFIAYLQSQSMVSNVSLAEVRQVDLHDLKGMDDVIASLEANIIVPLEHDDLARELGLKPKHGILLAGPPGTGKTTIGRALAHRLKSKFLLIDGTFISGSREFYQRIHQVFERAKENAPSIIFIDDSDAIFESGEELGLYRYLLTMLDGLESESADRVCVMMTAMDVSNLPPALIRSGRIDLWLETRLPDDTARAGILDDLLPALPAELAQVERGDIVAGTTGFTGADMNRLVEDAKSLFAYDRVNGTEPRSATEYFLAAIAIVQENRERYAAAESAARQRAATKRGSGLPPGMFMPDLDDD